ncbi:MAG: class I SAM-dependent methyltransferase [Clostridioides sp.]|nr:class I SAM-dependent methyltransferase [Clostridioides sp.]
MKLTNRLKKISEIVTPGSKIADIGTDHGYIPVQLLMAGVVPYAVLGDVNKGPLDNARGLVVKNKLASKVDFRLGSGIEVLEVGEVDEIIIAGMGGILISDILGANEEVAHNTSRLILQPMQAQDILREYLYGNGYEITEEFLVNEDFRMYEIIVAKYTGKVSKDIDEIYFEVGKKLIENKDPLLKDFVNKKIHTHSEILKNTEGVEGESVEKRRWESNEKISKLQEILDVYIEK